MSFQGNLLQNFLSITLYWEGIGQILRELEASKVKELMVTIVVVTIINSHIQSLRSSTLFTDIEKIAL